jgi:hypothetical protein
MILVLDNFLSDTECQFWRDYCVYANNNETMEVGLKSDKPMHRVDRNYYTVRSPFSFMDKVIKVVEEKWQEKFYFQHQSYGHIMHYKIPGQGLQWHAEPNIAKVSVSINLSPEHEYEGAEFEIKDHNIKLPLGSAIFYESNLQHRVTPLISGHKKSFVMWLPNEKIGKKRLK